MLKESIPPDLHDIIAQLLENNGSAPARLLPESVYLLRARIRQLEGDLQGAAEDYSHVREHAPKLIDDMEFADYERELRDALTQS
ncbi:hypothetical protein CWE12_02600 [Aliidiomarina sedimenti]|uniref:Uncharacterized protein n=1 Tax=Aliidiomarina sedimenti TaxID=1933879 RepID=A0ABY0C226_9GAMM|nr:hypothetical protein [Aliidiomarina sedimenti]RUO31905.1 hypothetical protein CWE12_02600 [Aliidiomarina sedimenti]